MKIFNIIANRAIAHWKSTVVGAAEAAVLAAAGVLTNDPKAFRLAMTAAAWCFARGMVSKDAK